MMLVEESRLCVFWSAFKYRKKEIVRGIHPKAIVQIKHGHRIVTEDVQGQNLRNQFVMRWLFKK